MNGSLKFLRLSHHLCLQLALSIGLTLPLAAQTHEASLTGTVSQVVDGDTFKLVGLTPSIRIWGLNAPETNQTGGSAATRTLRQLIESKDLTCKIQDIDRYGRIVGQCTLPDGRDIAEQMIKQGVAIEYCYFSRGFYGTC